MNYLDRLELRSNGFKTSQNLKKHINQNLSRLFKHELSIERVHLFLSKYAFGKSNFTYTLIMRVAVPGPDLIIEEFDENIEKLITKASHKMDRQIRKRSRKNNKSKKSVRLEDLPLAS